MKAKRRGALPYQACHSGRALHTLASLNQDEVVWFDNPISTSAAMHAAAWYIAFAAWPLLSRVLENAFHFLLPYNPKKPQNL